MQAILAGAAGPPRVGRAMVLVTVPGQLVPIVGPVLGGLVVDALGWRWVFMAQVPLCLLALVLGRRRVADGGRKGASAPDAWSAAFLVPGLTLAVYGLSRVGSGRAGSIAAGGAAGGAGAALTGATWVLAGATLLAAFVARSLRRRGEPLLDLSLFGVRSFVVGAALLFLSGLSIWAPMFVLPLFYQRVRGADALNAGVLLAPQGAGLALAMAVAGRFADRAGAARPMVAWGTAVAVAATVPFVVGGAGWGDAALGAALFARGVGLGLVGVPILAILYRDVARGSIGHATSLASVVQRCGAALGTAVLAVVLQSGLAAGGDVVGGASTGGMAGTAGTAGALGLPGPAGLPGPEGSGAAPAFGRAFLWVLAFTALTWIPALFHGREPAGREKRPDPRGGRGDRAAGRIHRESESAP